MQINFFKTNCKTSSNKSKFGLCDDPPPAEKPAYIDNNNTSKWIGIVDNTNNKEIDFYAIDHCITILRNNDEQESKCDGMLHFNNNLTFAELKDRGSKGWLKKGQEQLTTTINIFSKNHNIETYNKVNAYVCNKQRPLANTGNSTHIQKFKDDTGLLLNVKSNITI